MMADDESNDTVIEKRQSNPTEKGIEHFEQLNKPYLKRIQKVWDVLDVILQQVTKEPDKTEALLSLRNSISKHVDNLENETVPYLEFLNRHNTEQSKQQADCFNVTFRGYRILIESALRKLSQRIQDVQLQEHVSTSTGRTKNTKSSTKSSTTHSSITYSATKKRAKAEALKASLKFAEDEVILKKKQAEIELQHAMAQRATAELTAEIELLYVKREAAALDAEARALELGESSILQGDLDNLEHEDSVTRTNVYVNNIPYSYKNTVSFDTHVQEDYVPSQNEQVGSLMTSNQYSAVNNTDFTTSACDVPMQCDVPTLHNTHLTDSGLTSPAAQPEINNLPSDFTKFLLKRELVLSRFTAFNDKAEFYPSWKNSFKSIVNELQATPAEEVDLLVKWAGPGSQRHILSIKAANSSDSKRALTRIWLRMDERYGCPEMMESALKLKLDLFPAITNKDLHRLYDLSDVLDEIESAKEDKRYASLLGYFDSSTGVTPIVKKLPYSLHEKWTNHALKYMKQHEISFPPFSVFAAFVREQSRNKNNPSFAFQAEKKVDSQPLKRARERNITVAAHKTEVSKPEIEKSRKCPLHNTNHTLNKCKGFRMKTLEDRRRFLREKNICFRCCDTADHKQRDCKETVKCEECNSTSHPTALHISTTQRDGGEKSHHSSPQREVSQNQGDREITELVNSSCTQICGTNFEGKSCAKTVLVQVYPKNEPQRAQRMYAVIDDQSNRSLASPGFYSLFDVHSDLTTYELSSCGGTIRTAGRKAEGFVVESLDGSCVLNLPPLIECSQVPNIRNEIPTPEIARYYTHLLDIANFIPPLDPSAEILLLLGRDIIQAQHVIDQRLGHGNQPYGQKLKLGWTIIGETCLGKTHPPGEIRTYKTHMLSSGRVSLFPPCHNEFKLCEDTDDFGRNLFKRTKDDEKPGLSVDDHEFLRIMDNGFQKDVRGNWTAPLPFRQPRPKLPNNRLLALKRAKALDANLQKDPTKKKHFVEFMDGILRNGHAELAPPVLEGEECWYLPIFGIYHPKKPQQLRAVFDSSSKYDGLSLNDVLLTGPDMINSLLGVLLRFRKEPIAIMGDIQQMFYCFKVQNDHRNF